MVKQLLESSRILSISQSTVNQRFNVIRPNVAVLFYFDKQFNYDVIYMISFNSEVIETPR